MKYMVGSQATASLAAALGIAKTMGDDAIIINTETQQRFSPDEAALVVSDEPGTNNLAHDAAHEHAEYFRYGRYFSAYWEPDSSFRETMLKTASELGIEIESIDDLIRLCRDAYDYYWDAFENEACSNREIVIREIEALEAKPDDAWTDEDSETYAYLTELRYRI